MNSTMPDLSTIDSQWQVARGVYPIYRALAMQFQIMELSPELENPVAVSKPDVLARAQSWFDRMDMEVQVWQIRQILQSSHPASEENLRLLVIRHLTPGVKIHDLRDKVDFLLAQYFAHCARLNFHQSETTVADVAEVLTPVLGSFESNMPEWAHGLDVMLRELAACRSLNDMLDRALLQRARVAKQKVPEGDYFLPNSLVAITRFNFLVRLGFLRLMHVDLQAIREGLYALETRGITEVDCTNADLGTHESIKSIRAICHEWKKPFRASYSLGNSFRQIVEIRLALEIALSAIDNTGQEILAQASLPMPVEAEHPEAPELQAASASYPNPLGILGPAAIPGSLGVRKAKAGEPSSPKILNPVSTASAEAAFIEAETQPAAEAQVAPPAREIPAPAISGPATRKEDPPQAPAIAVATKIEQPRAPAPPIPTAPPLPTLSISPSKADAMPEAEVRAAVPGKPGAALPAKPTAITTPPNNAVTAKPGASRPSNPSPAASLRNAEAFPTMEVSPLQHDQSEAGTQSPIAPVINPPPARGLTARVRPAEEIKPNPVRLVSPDLPLTLTVPNAPVDGSGDKAPDAPHSHEAVAATIDIPAELSSEPKLGLLSMAYCMELIAQELLKSPAKGAAVCNIVVEGTKAVLASWEVSAFRLEDDVSLCLRRVVCCRVLVAVALDKHKKKEAQYLPQALSVVERENEAILLSIEDAKKRNDIDAAVNLSATNKKLLACIGEAHKVLA